MRIELSTQAQAEAIAGVLGDTLNGLTGSEISDLLRVCKMPDPAPSASKRDRLLAAFVASRNARDGRGSIPAFVRRSMKPERWLRDAARFEHLRANLNGALVLSGLACNTAGVLEALDRAQAIPEAERRARDLRVAMVLRGAHPEVVRCCRAELLAEDYFFVVIEAVKSIADKLRARTGLLDGGAVLADLSLGGRSPTLALNPCGTTTGRDEQVAFANLVKGVLGVFPDPTPCKLRAEWPIGREDAKDLLSLASFVHRRLDSAHGPARAEATLQP